MNPTTNPSIFTPQPGTNTNPSSTPYPVASPRPTMYQDAHSTGELPAPATASDRPTNWLSNHLSLTRSRENHANGKNGDAGHVVKDDPLDDESSEDDGVKWIYESIEIPGRSNGEAASSEAEKRRDRDEEEGDHGMTEARRQAARIALVNELKGEDRVALEVTNLYVFLTRDGTVITIYKKTRDQKVFGASILKRLRTAHTILRRSDDASLLVQAVLDYVVDKALEIVDRYHDRILKLERSILIRPKMGSVREMHILSGDLTLHKRTLAPIKSLIYGLRRYDLDRCKALVGSADPNADMENVRGYMSHQSKIYLADVGDHMDYILESMDMFGTIAENLIGYTFNTISYQTNETMRRLSLATIIFFPLTFLTGYFGMNFDAANGGFWGVRVHSDLFFWEIAIPMMAAFIFVWTWNDITRIGHVIKKRTLEKEYTLAHAMKTKKTKVA